MFSNYFPSQKAFKLFGILIGVMGWGITAVIAYAAINPVDTNDGALDAEWGTPHISADPNEVTFLDSVDINNAWIATDTSTPTEFYFRIETYAATAALRNFRAELDCDNDGNFAEAVDRIVFVDGGASQVVVVNDGTGTLITSYANTFSEIVATNNIEWRATATDLGTCPSGTIGVTFSTYNGAAQLDTTSVRGYNTPTAVFLTSTQAQTTSPSFQIVALFILVATTTIWLKRRTV